MTIEELLGIGGDVVRPPAGRSNQWNSTFGGCVAGVLSFEVHRHDEHGSRAAAVTQLSPVRPFS
jgi:hypothetical protein